MDSGKNKSNNLPLKQLSPEYKKNDAVCKYTEGRRYEAYSQNVLKHSWVPLGKSQYHCTPFSSS